MVSFSVDLGAVWTVEDGLLRVLGELTHSHPVRHTQPTQPHIAPLTVV